MTRWRAIRHAQEMASTRPRSPDTGAAERRGDGVGWRVRDIVAIQPA